MFQKPLTLLSKHSMALVFMVVGSPSFADSANSLLGRWHVPSFQQTKMKMSPQCRQYADTEAQMVPESEVEIVSCDDPAFAPQKARIEAFVAAVNQVYRAQNRPLYSETVSGLCAVVRSTKSTRKTDVCSPSEQLREEPIENLPIIWNIRNSGNEDWPLAGDSYSPSSGYGAISCFKKPVAGKLVTKGCRRWGLELPLLGSSPCDCGCTGIVCEEYAWDRE